jgi:NADH-quinone oxidoreductase subunit J
MLEQILFYTSSAFTIVGALVVLFSRNIVYSCMGLLLSLLGVAGIYLSLSADFLAVAQLMIYGVGVIVLMLFAIMLTRGGTFESKKQIILEMIPLMGNKVSYIIAIVVVSFNAWIIFLLINKLFNLVILPKNKSASESHFTNILGEALINQHAFAFEMISVLLLGALIGAVVIARPLRSMTDKDLK